jgi:hypothetical protein
MRTYANQQSQAYAASSDVPNVVHSVDIWELIAHHGKADIENNAIDRGKG